MVQTISGSQLSQTIATIEVVRRPLQSSRVYSNVEQNGNAFINKIKEIFSEAFFHHYAIILNTTEKEQLILHYLEEGFTSSILTYQERQCYSVIETYESSQFNKLFIVKELYDLRQLNIQDSLDYHILKNSCIHYVNHVKQYINKYLNDANEHAKQNIDLPNLISATKILTSNIYENILAFAKSPKLSKADIMNILKQNLKDPTLYYNMFYEAIRCASNQSKMQILGNSFIIAVATLLNKIPYINLILSLILILKIWFIWIQRDDKILIKIFKTVAILFENGGGIFMTKQVCKYIVDLISDLCKKYDIVEYTRTEKAIIYGCTIVVGFGGLIVENITRSTLLSASLIIPNFAKIWGVTAIKSCLLAISQFCIPLKAAAAPCGALLCEWFSSCAVATTVTTVTPFITISTTATTSSATIAASATIATPATFATTTVTMVKATVFTLSIPNIIIGAIVGAVIGIGICYLLRKKKK